ncbi:MAG TPA: ABC transporter permease [Solirubrobacteraceae bacterium]|nr:ABC transporter permease [Solirubrobacteraceae bacterium]
MIGDRLLAPTGRITAEARARVGATSAVPTGGTPVRLRLPRLGARLGTLAGALAGIALLVGLWSIIYATRAFPANLFPSVPRILSAGAAMWREGLLGPDITDGVRRALIGFVLGTGAGVSLALITATTRPGRIVIQPILRVLAPIPTIGLVPLAILWFGIGESAKDIVVALGVFVPVWINSHAGLASTPVDFLRVSECLGASRRQTLTRVIIPEALPDIVAGTRVGAAMAFVVIVVAELTGTTNGLGYRISQAQLFSQADRLIFCLVLLGLLGALWDQVIAQSTRRWIRWSTEES